MTLGVGAEADALDLVDVGYAGGDGAHCSCCVAQAAGSGDLARVRVGQCAGKVDVKADEACVGL